MFGTVGGLCKQTSRSGTKANVHRGTATVELLGELLGWGNHCRISTPGCAVYHACLVYVNNKVIASNLVLTPKL